ncbi:MAG: glycerol-3-phosphate acyltransferase, partial [Peptostreptococcaceae bacterium]|nr:glycerol-3-phosphate acyltransferase [Peptostreptococcaceae bacterium]
MIGYIIIIVASYLLGNISTSYIIAKKMLGVDIRTQGSGNAGSTNALRVLGKKAGAMTFIGDLLKG